VKKQSNTVFIENAHVKQNTLKNDQLVIVFKRRESEMLQNNNNNYKTF